MSRTHHEQEIRPWKCFYGIECYCVDENNIKLSWAGAQSTALHSEERPEMSEDILQSLHYLKIADLKQTTTFYPYWLGLFGAKVPQPKLCFAFEPTLSNCNTKGQVGKIAILRQSPLRKTIIFPTFYEYQYSKMITSSKSLLPCLYVLLPEHGTTSNKTMEPQQLHLNFNYCYYITSCSGCHTQAV